MKILLLAATPLELEPIQRMLEKDQSSHEITCFVSGVGMVATTFSLTKELTSNSYDLAINLGIAGAFDRTIALGEVVEVVQDQISEELIEDGLELRTYQEVGLKTEESILLSTFKIPDSTLKKVSGITVNRVHGNEQNIAVIFLTPF